MNRYWMMGSIVESDGGISPVYDKPIEINSVSEAKSTADSFVRDVNSERDPGSPLIGRPTWVNEGLKVIGSAIDYEDGSKYIWEITTSPD